GTDQLHDSRQVWAAKRLRFQVLVYCGREPTNSNTWQVINLSCCSTEAFMHSPAESNTFSLVLICTPSGVGHPRIACTMARRLARTGPPAAPPAAPVPHAP